jgi:hypothetical protein
MVVRSKISNLEQAKKELIKKAETIEMEEITKMMN